MSKLAVANTIIDQLGGARRLVLMVNAKNFLGLPDSVSFKFSGSRDFPHVRITLTPADTYTVKFLKLNGIKVGASKEYTDVYADQLVDIFESATKLYLSFRRAA